MTAAPDISALQREIASARDAVDAARITSQPLDVLAQVTIAIERLTATQHELVNVLLDHGVSWSDLGTALSTSSAAAARRFPRRAHGASPGGSDRA